MSRSDYTNDERCKILWYIIKNERHLVLRGNTVWKDMERAKVCNRTWQSMKGHFKKKIITNLNYFDIPQDKKDKLLKGYMSTCVRKKTNNGLTVRLPMKRAMVFSSDEEPEIRVPVTQPHTHTISSDENSNDSMDALTGMPIRYTDNTNKDKQIIQLSPEVDIINRSPSKLTKVALDFIISESSPDLESLNSSTSKNKSKKVKKTKVQEAPTNTVLPSTSRVEGVLSTIDNKKTSEATNTIQEKTNENVQIINETNESNETLQKINKLVRGETNKSDKNDEIIIKTNEFNKRCENIVKKKKLTNNVSKVYETTDNLEETHDITNRCIVTQKKDNEPNQELAKLTKCVRFEAGVTEIDSSCLVQVENSTEKNSTELNAAEKINKATQVTPNKFELNLLNEKLIEVDLDLDRHVFVSARDMKNLLSRKQLDLPPQKENTHIVNSETFDLLKNFLYINKTCDSHLQAVASINNWNFVELQPSLARMKDILNKIKQNVTEESTISALEPINSSCSKLSSAEQQSSKYSSHEQQSSKPSSHEHQSSKPSLEQQRSKPSSKQQSSSLFSSEQRSSSIFSSEQQSCILFSSGQQDNNLPDIQKTNPTPESESMDMSVKSRKKVLVSEITKNNATQKHVSSQHKINMPSPELLQYLISEEPRKLDNLAGIPTNCRSSKTNNFESQKYNSLQKVPKISPPFPNISSTPVLQTISSQTSDYQKIKPVSKLSQKATKILKNGSWQNSKKSSVEVLPTQESQKSSMQSSQNASPGIRNSILQTMQEIQRNSLQNSNENQPNSQFLVSFSAAEDVETVNVMTLLNDESRIASNESTELPSSCENELYLTAYSQM